MRIHVKLTRQASKGHAALSNPSPSWPHLCLQLEAQMAQAVTAGVNMFESIHKKYKGIFFGCPLVRVSSQEQATVIWIVILLVLSDFAKFSTLEGQGWLQNATS